jgi:hypothetical protein
MEKSWEEKRGKEVQKGREKESGRGKRGELYVEGMGEKREGRRIRKWDRGDCEAEGES